MKIIIADDQKHTRAGLRAFLSASLASPEIWEAATGREAQRLADEVRPDLILMDIRMPDVDGLSATQNIKSSHPGIPILVLSLDAGSELAARAAGADAFICKGENPLILLDAVTRLVVQSRGDEPRNQR